MSYIYKSSLDMEPGDIVKYTGTFFAFGDHPHNLNRDNPFGVVIKVQHEGHYPSALVRWDHTGLESWAFRSSLVIVSEMQRQSDLGWARSYLNDMIEEAHRTIEAAQRRLEDLP